MNEILNSIIFYGMLLAAAFCWNIALNYLSKYLFKTGKTQDIFALVWAYTGIFIMTFWPIYLDNKL